MTQSCSCLTVCQAYWLRQDELVAEFLRHGLLGHFLVALSEKASDLASHLRWHFQRQRLAGYLRRLLVGREEFDALWAVGQMAIEALSVFGGETAAKVVHAVVDQLTAANPNDSFVRLHVEDPAC